MKVQDSQAYWEMDVRRERISHILELIEIFLSFQTGFNLVNAAVVCAIKETIWGFEPLSVITEPRYLKIVTVSMNDIFSIGNEQLCKNRRLLKIFSADY